MKVELSNCCGANMQGEPSNNQSTGVLEGRCSYCKEMSSFTGVVEINFIKSFYPLGTQNGVDYHIYPSETR